MIPGNNSDAIEGLDAFRAVVRSQGLNEIELHDPPMTVDDFADYEKVPDRFPRPSDHLVIADHLICLPVIAVDRSKIHGHYGRVLAYCDGDVWKLADSLDELAERLQQVGSDAVWGQPYW